jgi:SAM-dependent methyltransferase
MLTNLEEYAHPNLYDLENDDFEPEGSFFLDLARRFGGPVLELGCGTGRITIPLAQAGIDMTGLDIMPAMLEFARRKAQGLLIEWIQADARSYHLPRRYRLIFECGSVFMHMLERADQRAFLARAREHLEDRGALVFGVRFPHPDNLTDVDNEQDWFSYTDEQGHTVRVSGIEKYDELRQVKLETAFRRWSDADGREVCHVAPLALRYTFPQEMELLLQTCGFHIIERYGGADASPLNEKSPFMVFVCMKEPTSDAATLALD